MRYECTSSRFQIKENYEALTLVTKRDEFVSSMEEQQPNIESKKLYDLLKAAQRLLWEGCSIHNELSVIVRLLRRKTKYNES